jgi:molybdenum cofactor biosynthesis enzyme MoaA
MLLFAVPFFLMVYCLRCERLRLSSQKKLIERLIEEQRTERHKKEMEEEDPGCPSNLPERY